jgi:hypothetical protein
MINSALENQWRAPTLQAEIVGGFAALGNGISVGVTRRKRLM